MRRKRNRTVAKKIEKLKNMIEIIAVVMADIVKGVVKERDRHLVKGVENELKRKQFTKKKCRLRVAVRLYRRKQFLQVSQIVIRVDLKLRLGHDHVQVQGQVDLGLDHDLNQVQIDLDL